MTRATQIALLLLSALLAMLGGTAAMLAVVVTLASRPDSGEAPPRLADAIDPPAYNGGR